MTFRELITALRRLDIDRSRPVIVHAATSTIGDVHGGAESTIGALSSSFDTWLIPAFTYKTMITPELGPPDNGMSYGSGKDANRMAEIFRLDMPVDPSMGVLAEAVRLSPKSRRSTHPILSFVGINAGRILETQSMKEPLSPIKALKELGGWVLLIGVDHTTNTSIHCGEQLAGRKQFVRWALTPRGIIPCYKFPGCSAGFEEISTHLIEVTRRVDVGGTSIQAIPVVELLESVCAILAEDPFALLCSQADCECCNAVRTALSRSMDRYSSKNGSRVWAFCNYPLMESNNQKISP